MHLVGKLNEKRIEIDNISDTNRPRQVFKLALTIDEAEFVLIALSALERMEEDSSLSRVEAIQKARKFYNSDKTPIFRANEVSVFMDRLYAPVFDYLFDNDLLKSDDYDEDAYITSLETPGEIVDTNKARFGNEY